MTLPRPAEDARPAQNAVYGEAFGAAVFLSVNYERMLGDGIAARIGIGPGFISTISGRGERSALDFLVPMTVSYAAIGSDRHKLELGGGATMLHVTAARDSGGLLGYQHSGFGFYGDAFAGYRYQPPHGFTLRAGVNALIAFPNQAWPVIPWPYLALGGSF